jgi:hypothetical protein
VGGAGFREEYEREWLYGAFLAFGLQATGSFAGLIVLQQVLGLAAVGWLWVTWRLWLRLFPENFLRELLLTVLGLALAGLYLVNPITRTLELSLRPEALLTFVAFAQLAAITAFLRWRWQARTPAPPPPPPWLARSPWSWPWRSTCSNPTGCWRCP